MSDDKSKTEPAPAATAPPAAGYPAAGAPPAGYPAAGAPPAGYPAAGAPPAGYPAAGAPPAGYAGGPPPAGYAGGPPPAGYAGGPPPAGYAGGPPPAGYAGGPPPAGYAGGPPPAGYQTAAYGAPGPHAVAPRAGGLPVMVVPATPQHSLFSALEALRGLFIYQKIELLEVLTGCETKNRYQVYGWDPEKGQEKAKHGKIKPKLFKAKEDSECLQRICCGPARTFTMDVKGAGKVVAKNDTDLLHLVRPFKCTCACFCRSKMHVTHPGAGEFSELYNPWTCCNLIVEVRKPTEGPAAEVVAAMPDHWYTIRAKCLQPAACCHCPCAPFNKFEFGIYRPDDEAFESPIGALTKVWDSCLRSAFTDADNFTIEFPAEANVYQKAALLSAAIFIDFLYFEEKGQGQGGAGAAGY